VQPQKKNARNHTHTHTYTHTHVHGFAQRTSARCSAGRARVPPLRVPDLLTTHRAAVAALAGSVPAGECVCLCACVCLCVYVCVMHV